ncbi:DUF4835 family protein [Flavobacteriaceae bacterium]|jgi:hypothetical protein|nr:DUF4835 family protein [Flavobacteriaceae bacterium]
MKDVKKTFFLFNFMFLSGLFFSFSQDFKANIQVDASRVNQSNTEIFQNLENQLTEFMNNTSFSGRKMAASERIAINIYLNISNYQDNSFEGSLQIQSSRPIYQTNYESPLVLLKDPAIAFNYQEFTPLVLNENRVDSNLVAVFSFYAWVLIALDADTYAFNGGDYYYRKAQNVLGMAQANGFSGWTLNNKAFNKPLFLNLLVSSESLMFKKALYEYHLNGLDKMHGDPLKAKTEIIKAISYIQSFGNNGTHRTLVQGFFDAKAKEIQELFVAGPNVDTKGLVKSLQTLAPLFGNYWSDIK